MMMLVQTCSPIKNDSGELNNLVREEDDTFAIVRGLSGSATSSAPFTGVLYNLDVFFVQRS